MNNFNYVQIFKLYNSVSDKEIKEEDIKMLLPKLGIILSNIKLDNIEIIDLIDTLLEFEKYNRLDDINIETINILVTIVRINKNELEETLYFPLLLKLLLLPYNIIQNQDKNEIILFLSEFELLLDLFLKIDVKNKQILLKYNEEFVKVVSEYNKAISLCRNNKQCDLMLEIMISHLSSLLYFNQVFYNKNYELIVLITQRIIDNYNDFVNYLKKENVTDNIIKVDSDIIKEYEVCKKMLDFIYTKEEKRKCKR